MDKVYRLAKKKLEQIEPDSFESERAIQNIVEDNTDELFGVKLVKSEFVAGNYRIDTLCFDEESSSFVIIEYKKSKSYSVIDQGYAYLSTMLDRQADFYLALTEYTNTGLKIDQVDWTQSRIIFISPSFSAHQKDSVNFKDVPFELWEVSKFSGDLISFNAIKATSKAHITQLSGNKNPNISKVSETVKVYDEEYHLGKMSPQVKNLYLELKESMSEWESINFRGTKHYISITKKDKVKIYLFFQKEGIKISILRRFSFKKGEVGKQKARLDLEDPKGLFPLKSNDYKERYQHSLKDSKNLDYVILCLRQAYDA